MIDTLTQLRLELEHSYSKIILPKDRLDTPMGLDKMAKPDGGRYSFNEVSEALGQFFQPVPYIDDRFVLIRWSCAANGADTNLIDYLTSIGLVNMRGVDNSLEIEQIDFTALNGDEFLIVRDWGVTLIPKIKTETE